MTGLNGRGVYNISFVTQHSHRAGSVPQGRPALLFAQNSGGLQAKVALRLNRRQRNRHPVSWMR